MQHHLLRAAITLAVTAAPSAAFALAKSTCECGYVVPHLAVTGDHHYANLSAWNGGSDTWCNYNTLVGLEAAYGLKRVSPGGPIQEWGPGYGYMTCDIERPFGRTLNAITALATASPNTLPGPLNQVHTAAFPLLDWAYAWTAQKMNATHAKCENGDGEAIAYEKGGTVELYVRVTDSCNMAFFHGHDVVERAGTLVHESRHVNGPAHCCAGATKDMAFGDGGAWDYEATWLQQFAHNGVNSVPWLSCSAALSARTILELAFIAPTPYKISLPAHCKP